MSRIIKPTLILLMSACIMVFLQSCEKQQPAAEPTDEAQPQMSPPHPYTVVIISPHNEEIRTEMETAFTKYCKEEFGIDAKVDWMDVGTGSNRILKFIQKVYAHTKYYGHTDLIGVDMLFGGGEYTFQTLEKEGVLETLPLNDEVLANIPQTFCGMEMYSTDHKWCGNVLGTFGFLYNKEMLNATGATAPTKWEDLGGAEYFNQAVFADPTVSGSMAGAFEMIVQTSPDWQSGWEKLLSILSNAKKFTDSSNDAVDAPGLDEAIVSICIDFYGTSRASQAPDKLQYVTPKGQAGYTPDPIGIFKNASNRDMANKFVDFLLSVKGQRIWALPKGHPDGPVEYSLNRIPISKAYYAQYDADTPEWIARPYAADADMMDMDMEMRTVRFGVLSELVKTAAIDNIELMQQAKKKLIDSGNSDDIKAMFYKLPENVDTLEEIKALAVELEAPEQTAQIAGIWRDFFKSQYEKILNN